MIPGATIKVRHYRSFTACRLQVQGLFTALYTETYPGFSQACLHHLHDICAGFSTESSTGFPQPIYRVVNQLAIWPKMHRVL